MPESALTGPARWPEFPLLAPEMRGSDGATAPGADGRTVRKTHAGKRAPHVVGSDNRLNVLWYHQPLAGKSPVHGRRPSEMPMDSFLPPLSHRKGRRCGVSPGANTSYLAHSPFPVPEERAGMCIPPKKPLSLLCPRSRGAHPNASLQGTGQPCHNMYSICPLFFPLPFQAAALCQKSSRKTQPKAQLSSRWASVCVHALGQSDQHQHRH